MTKLTLQSLKKEQDSIKDDISEIKKLLVNLSNSSVANQEDKVFEYDLEEDKVITNTECPMLESLEAPDKFGNVFTSFKDIYFKLNKHVLSITDKPMRGFTQVSAQLVSSFKNGIDKDFRLTSKDKTIPNCNQLSFNKSAKLAGAVSGTHMSGTTHLYLMLLHIWRYHSRDNQVANETYSWSEERDCAWKNTSSKESVFGLCQLYNAGYTFVDIRDLKDDMFKAYKEILVRGDVKDLDSTDEKFAFMGGYDSSTNNLFCSRWCDRFVGSWYSNDYALRLCKNK